MTTKPLGQVLYEAFVSGHRGMNPWPGLAPDAQADFEREAQAVAAVVRGQSVLEAAMQRNRADLLAEDIEALHLCLDRNGVPRVDNEQEAVYSMWGRVLLLMEATRERCAQKAREQAVNACEAQIDAIRPRCIEYTGHVHSIGMCIAAIRSMKP